MLVSSLRRSHHSDTSETVGYFLRFAAVAQSTNIVLFRHRFFLADCTIPVKVIPYSFLYGFPSCRHCTPRSTVYFKFTPFLDTPVIVSIESVMWSRIPLQPLTGSSTITGVDNVCNTWSDAPFLWNSYIPFSSADNTTKHQQYAPPLSWVPPSVVKLW